MTTQGLSRRSFLKSGTLAGLAAAYHGLPAWMPRLAFAQPYNDPRGDVLVVVFLRGGADALNMIVPHGDKDYYAARPNLAIPQPDATNAEGRVLDLDGFFGLHPALSPLLPIFSAGQMTAIHATGSPSATRSHFEAMGFMERGTPDDYALSTGWIGRHLATLATDNTSPVRGIGWGTAVQASLIGAPSVVAMQSIVDYHLAGDAQAAARMMESLGALYAIAEEPLAQSAASTQGAMDVVASIGYADYVPQHGAEYPENDFGLALRQTAALIRAQVGLEVSCIDLGGWDTHAGQGTVDGIQAALMTQLAEGLAAFHQDMSAELSRVTVVVMSEFGRRVAENASLGTDHGHGGAMLVLNGDLKRGPVVADWRGLTPDALDRGEDLAITTDYRDILAEILVQRLDNPDLEAIFPNYTPGSVGLFT